MMDGPQHYEEAERLLAVCAGPQRGSALDVACTAAAQVHATLALAWEKNPYGRRDGGLERGTGAAAAASRTRRFCAARRSPAVTARASAGTPATGPWASGCTPQTSRSRSCSMASRAARLSG